MISSVTTPSVGAILSRSPARLPEGWRSIVGVGVSPVGYVLGRAANAVASFVGKAWRKVDVPKQAEAAKRAEAARQADAPRPAAAVPRDLPPTYAEFAKSQAMLDAFQSFMATSITDEHGQFMLNAQAFLRHASGKSATPDSIRTFFSKGRRRQPIPSQRRVSRGPTSGDRTVNVRHHAEALLAEFGRLVGLPALTYEPHGCARLVFEGGIHLDLEIDATSRCVHASVVLGRMPADGREAALRALLEANLPGRQPGGATLSVDGRQDEAVLSRRIELAPELSGKAFGDALNEFVNQAEDWQRRLANGALRGTGEAAVAPPTPLAMQMRA